MEPFRYSIWLVPCAEQRAALQQTINSLSARFGTASFAPHATLCSGLWKKPEAELFSAVEKVGRSRRERRLPGTQSKGGWLGEPSLPMKTDGIGWIDRWFGFFFMRLRCEADLFSKAAELVEGSHPPEVGPHLSLLYSFGDPSIDREALRFELAGTLPEVIRFDSLALVRPATGRWKDVAEWDVLGRTTEFT